MKIQNKISLILTGLTAGIILSLSIFIYIFAFESTSRSFFHRLEVRSNIVGHAALQKNQSRSSIYYDIKEKHLGDLPFEKHYIIEEGKPEKFKHVRKGLPLPESFYRELDDKKSARYFEKDSSYVGLKIFDNGKDITIISSALDLYGLEEMENLKKLLVIGFLIAMAFVFTFSRFFSRQIFQPIRKTIRKVKGINAENLHERLVVGASRDEIAHLSATFNEMLDRLEITFDMQNNFVSNASHEFRTPLTIISGEAELGSLMPDLPEQVANSFRTILHESEKLEHLTNSMLSLAQTGFDGKREQWGIVRIDELIFEVKGNIELILPGNAVEINFDELPEDETKLIVVGSETLLKVAFTNIILNSCKYSDNKPVSVAIKADRNKVIVQITDRGIGIPDSEVGQIFVPFFRASNTKAYEGYGIGLPLANNIVKMHKGTIDVTSQVDIGTSFTVRFPCKY